MRGGNSEPRAGLLWARCQERRRAPLGALPSAAGRAACMTMGERSARSPLDVADVGEGEEGEAEEDDHKGSLDAQPAPASGGQWEWG